MEGDMSSVPHEEPVQKMAARFENNVIAILKELDFKDVNGGPSFIIGGIQVDACGGHEDTLLLIECTKARRRSRKSVRDKLKEFKGVIPILSKAFHKDTTYLKYKRIKYILAVSNIEIRDVDKEFAKENPKVYIWDEQLVEYYKHLHNMIGTASRYNLLGEIEVGPRVQSVIQIPALATSAGNSIIYSFFIEPQRLLQASYVARREIGNEAYYQRLLKRDRIRKIRDFVRKGNLFPNNVIVAFNKRPKFTPFRELPSQSSGWPEWLEFGILSFPADYRTCWIIDGQHRLYSFADVKTNTKISVAAFENIPIDKQARYFIEINREQKPVEPDLLWDLEGEMRPNSPEGIISGVVKRLNQYEPLKDRIYIPLRGKRRKGQLKFSGLCMSIQQNELTKESTVSIRGGVKNPLYSNDYHKTIDRVSKVLATFLQRIDATLSSEEKSEFAFTNSGLILMITLFKMILVINNVIPSQECMDKYLVAFQQFLLAKYPDKKERSNLRQMCTSKGGIAKILPGMVRSIRAVTGDKAFGINIPDDDFDERIKRFERKLANFVVEVIGIQSIQDLQKYAPKDLCGRIIERQSKAKAKGIPQVNLPDYLTLGECKVMIQDSNNFTLFNPIFVASQSGFGAKIELDGALQAVTDCSADIRHGRIVTYKYKEKERISMYLDILEKCIDEHQIRSGG